MNPMMQKVLGSLIRSVLTLLVPSLVAAGVWTPEESTAVIATVSTALAALLLSFYEKYKSQQKLVTALASPAGATQKQVERQISEGLAPPVTLAKTEAPYLNPAPK